MDCYSRQACIVFFLILATTTSVLGQGTKIGFYSKTCPNAEAIVKSTVQKHFGSDSAIAPGLLRMHFHDCFVRGCDGSILLDGAGTEKTAAPNLRLRGYEVIDDAKAQLETSCKGVVSCADILALAARDSVVLTGGQSWSVPTGRRDGTTSLASENGQLPGFRDSVDLQKQKFTAKGLNTQDLVALVGAHTIGTSACQFFSYRLYNFNSTGLPDPSMDPTFLSQLQSLCPQNGDGSTRVGLDNGSSGKFDTSYYSNLRNNKGVLESDQRLWADSTTKGYVQRLTGLRGSQSLIFNIEFGKSMVKMSNIEVETGSVGEIRTVCSKIN